MNVERIGCPKRKVIAVYEPRSATSRRRTFQDEFADAFAHADEVIVGKLFDPTRIPKEERDVSALTLVLSEEGFRTFRQELKELRARMVQLSEAENKKFWTGVAGDSRRVYQSLLQVFPVSQVRNSREEP